VSAFSHFHSSCFSRFLDREIMTVARIEVLGMGPNLGIHLVPFLFMRIPFVDGPLAFTSSRFFRHAAAFFPPPNLLLLPDLVRPTEEGRLFYAPLISRIRTRAPMADVFVATLFPLLRECRSRVPVHDPYTAGKIRAGFFFQRCVTCSPLREGAGRLSLFFELTAFSQSTAAFFW